MRDFIDKLRILWSLLAGAFRQWKVEVWQRDLDSYYCCNGHECGCYADTVRQVYLCTPRAPAEFDSLLEK